MRFRYLFLLLALLLGTTLEYGQSLPAEEPIRPSGIIVNEADALPFVTVTNLATQQGVMSNKEGFFYIAFLALAHDTLQLSAVN